MTRLDKKNYNIILTETLQNNHHYHQVKLINRTIFQAKKYYLLIKAELQKKVHLIYFSLGIALAKQIKTIGDVAKKQAKAIKDRLEKEISDMA